MMSLFAAARQDGCVDLVTAAFPAICFASLIPPLRLQFERVDRGTSALRETNDALGLRSKRRRVNKIPNIAGTIFSSRLPLFGHCLAHIRELDGGLRRSSSLSARLRFDNAPPSACGYMGSYQRPTSIDAVGY